MYTIQPKIPSMEVSQIRAYITCVLILLPRNFRKFKPEFSVKWKAPTRFTYGWENLPPIRVDLTSSVFDCKWSTNHSTKVIYPFLDQMVYRNSDAWYPLRMPCIATDQIVCLCDPLSSDEPPPAKKNNSTWLPLGYKYRHSFKQNGDSAQ